LEELYSASEQYLIEKGVGVYNNPILEVSIKVLKADDESGDAPGKETENIIFVIKVIKNG
jgi:hypothetical protein